MRAASGLRYWLLQSGDGFLLPLVILAFFWQLGAPALFDLDEGAFSAATWEMLQRHDFITTFLNGEPRFDKPILIYWLQALSVSTFGLSEWSLRLPSALAASAWVMTTYYFAKPRIPRRNAILTAVMVATSAMIVIIGRAAIADALLNLLIALTLFDIWRYWEQPSRMLLFRVFLWLGLGFLCKGPVAVAIPLVVSAFLYISNGQWKTWLQTVFSPFGLVVFLAVAAPWYILEYLAQGQAFIDGFFFKHNVSRFSDTMEGHGGHLWYYFVALPFMILPFSGLLVQVLRSHPSLSLPLSGEGAESGMPSSSSPDKGRLGRVSFTRFLWFWFLFVFVFFSFSNTQLPHYLLYGTTPLLLLLAKHCGDNPNRWLALVPAILVAGILLFLPELLAKAVTQNPTPYFQGLLEQFRKVTEAYYRLAVGIYLLALLALLLWPKVQNYLRLIGAAILQTLFISSILIPVVAYTQQAAVQDLARAARQMTGSTIVMDGVNMPSFTVYRQALTPRRAPEIGEYVFSKEGHLQPAENYMTVFKQGGLILARRMR
ncbi:ArnT family glycosyltransferase [Thiothrix nivea]|uniref:Glycosyl transferase family 39 n=1 Tax=Thiothrix nivea (strain ATCC 35100 / DSM 5205 / JP2) TaxID=870187 RepID=A0A656HKL4_THINJ|nr:glycosyltransferase family 39 protein [Thiothrix nivea]EIJ35565.1 glycosyl transferase family 39 [Thiothrix nivea DSM 5205]